MREEAEKGNREREERDLATGLFRASKPHHRLYIILLREFLSSVSWAVDQLTIDPEGEAPEPAEPSLPPAPPPAPRPYEPGPGGAARLNCSQTQHNSKPTSPTG